MSDNRDGNKNGRKRFMCITYSLAAIFMILAIVQWYLFHILEQISNYFTINYWIGIVFFMLSLVLLLIFVFLEELRFYTPFNGIVAFTLFECVVLGITTLIVRHYRYHFLTSFGIWTLVLIIFLLIGSCISHDLTLDIVVIVIISIVSIIGAMYFLMLHLVMNAPYSFFVYRGFIVISVSSFIMYHAQIINGGRFAEIREKDYFLAALILFFDFLLMFIFTFQLAPSWSDPCDTEKNKTIFLIVDSHIKGFRSEDLPKSIANVVN